MIYTVSPDEARVCASGMVANGALVLVPELLSLPVGEIYQVAADTDEVCSRKSSNAAAKTLQNKPGFNTSIPLAVCFSFGLMDGVYVTAIGADKRFAR